MFETLAAAAIAAGVVLFIRILAGSASDDSGVVGVFTSPRMPARPRGTQETDLAPFAFPAEPVSAGGARIVTLEPRLDPARAA